MTTEPRGHSSSGSPRTLAEDLRARPDATLAGLLHARPDLFSPVPRDVTQLATRAGTRVSVRRALERLDQRALQTAEALAVAPDPCPYPLLAGLLPELEGAGVLPLALTALRERALVWGDDSRLRLVRTAHEVLAPTADQPSATGLGPTLAEASSGMSPGRLQRILATLGLPATPDPVTAVAALGDLFADDTRMAQLLEAAPSAASQVLARLVWGPPYGSVHTSAATVSGGGGVSGQLSAPVTWLLDRGLLLPASPTTVVLPREVALHLRGGRAHRTTQPLPPTVTTSRTHDPRSVDGAAAGQALAALTTVDELLTRWETEGPPVLRAGGLGVREVKRTAVALDVSEPVATFWIELAYAAGLLAADGEVAERYAPTPAFDEWRARPPEQRWATLVTAWLTATRVPGAVGTRDAKGRALTPLGPGLDQPVAPGVRRRTLELLAGLEPGAVAEPAALLARLTWEQPLRVPEDLRTRLVDWTVQEAELLGVTGRGAVPSFARELFPAPPEFLTGASAAPSPGTADPPGEAVDGASAAVWGPARIGGFDPAPPTAAEWERCVEAATTALAPLLPEPVDHVLLQADLTAVAPGPLVRPLAALLNVVAEVESKGGATVYRFTPESVRRALDAGHSPAELHALLREHSRTPVPQPLGYLIDDVARRHGRLRVGSAAGYLRCADDALLTEILADRRAEGLGLRRLAPTVLATRSAPDVVLTRLREMGYAPAAESAEGDVVVARPEAHRAPPRTPPEPVLDGPPVPDARLLLSAVRAIRAGDRAGGGEPVGDRSAPGAGRDGDGDRASAGLPPADDGPGRVPGAGSSARSRSGSGDLPRTGTADTLAALQYAALTGGTVRIGYVSAAGTASRRVIAPVRVEGGYVTGYDHTANEVRTYPLHRVTGVAEQSGGAD